VLKSNDRCGELIHAGLNYYTKKVEGVTISQLSKKAEGRTTSTKATLQARQVKLHVDFYHFKLQTNV